MGRTILSAALGLCVLTLPLAAQDIQRGTIKKVDAGKGTLTIVVEGKAIDVIVTDQTKIFDADMREVGKAVLRNPPPPPKLPTKLGAPLDRLPQDLQAARLWASRKLLAERDLACLTITDESWRQEFIALRRERLSRRRDEDSGQGHRFN